MLHPGNEAIAQGPRRSSVATQSTMPDAAAARLIRAIGFWGLAAIILNGMIGAGIFALPGSVAHYAGGWAPIVILLVGAALLPVVLVFAMLSARFDESGGPIRYVEAAFGPIAAFQTGWMQNLSTASAAAANANLLADYLLRLAPAAAGNTIIHAAIVLGGIALVLAINLAGARQSSGWMIGITIAKLLPLALLLLLALPMLLAGVSPLPPGQWSLAQAVLLAVYAFIGFEGALSIAGDGRNPRRDFPRALVAVFLVVVGIYALTTWSYIAIAYRPGQIDKAALSTMAVALLGAGGALLLVAAAALSIFGNITATMLGISRRLLGMQELGMLPRWFGIIHANSGLPRNGVLASFAAIVLLAMSGGFVWLAVLSVVSRLLIYIGCIAALPVIQRREGQATSVAAGTITLLAMATCLALLSQSEARAWAGAAITIAIGFLVKAAARHPIDRLNRRRT